MSERPLTAEEAQRAAFELVLRDWSVDLSLAEDGQAGDFDVLVDDLLATLATRAAVPDAEGLREVTQKAVEAWDELMLMLVARGQGNPSPSETVDLADAINALRAALASTPEAER